MSRFFTDKYKNLTPYTPGEQPKDTKYVKLNTNESPYPPSPSVIEAVKNEGAKLNLYSDPEVLELRKKLAEIYSVDKDEIIVTNGSDEVLNFAFMAFADKIIFPEITYGFYPVFAQLNNIEYEQIPLNEDFTINVNDYISQNKTIVIANPNAPTGLFMSLSDIEKIVKSNPDNIVIIDEAYVDFGGESAISLVPKYDNLIVTQTFSKSRSMAGARLGFGIASKELIRDMNTIRYSTNPYNVNRMTEFAGVNALCDNAYYMDNAKKIIETRKWTQTELEKLGFEVLDSKANFLFAKNNSIGGEELYLKLKERKILVRHFTKEKICEYNRITIGTPEQMQILISNIKVILKEQEK